MRAYWLDENLTVEYTDAVKDKRHEIKKMEIPLLASYEKGADGEFWNKFPKKDLPRNASTRVNIDALKERVEGVKNFMTCTKARRADRVLSDLATGAEANQKCELPPLNSYNAKSAYDNGALLTDVIATWIKKGFVAGPFDAPPMAGFRANPLATVVRNGKVRPILNMSGPKGKSFNDNVDKARLERLHMGTARQFSLALLDTGQNAVFSKFDLQDAYKLIPARVEDYRLHGFCWLGKYFVETQQGFGGVPSPSNFDRLAKTKDLIVCIESGTPRSQVFRALDDSPCVAKASSGIVEKFSSKIKEVCRAVNIPLADICQKAEKAFELQTRGTVLGIGFNSTNLTWFLSKEKADKVIRRCLDVVYASHVDLQQMQQLMGSVNDVGQMCPSVKFHKRGGNALLTSFGGNKIVLKMVPEKLNKELLVIAKIVHTVRTNLEIIPNLRNCNKLIHIYFVKY